MSQTTAVATVNSQGSNVGMLAGFTSMTDMLSWGDTILESGILPSSIATPEAVCAIALYGQELGLKPMESFQNIHIIAQRPTISSAYLGKLLKDSGVEYICTKNFEPITKDGKAVDYVTEIEFTHWSKLKGEAVSQSYTFKWSDAIKMELTKKDNWKKMPSLMLYWRCLTFGIRTMYPDVLGGSVYTTDEIADVKDVTYEMAEDGTIEVNP